MRRADRAPFPLLLAVSLGGCWIEEPPPPPPFDCAAIDRADERFPALCGDAGTDEDAGVEEDAGVDSGT